MVQYFSLAPIKYFLLGCSGYSFGMNPRWTLFAVFLSFWAIVIGSNEDEEINNNLEPETKNEQPQFGECIALDQCGERDVIDLIELGIEEGCGSGLVCCLFDTKESFDSDTYKLLSTLDESSRNVTNETTTFDPPTISDIVMFGEFPWMGLIFSSTVDLKSNKHINLFECGASLLTSKIILTAARCVAKLEISSLRVRLGEYDTKDDSEILPFQDREVKSVEIHPEYDENLLYNDLALLIVKNPFELQQHIAPIYLPKVDLNSSRHNHEYDPNNCLVMGWGRNNFSFMSHNRIPKKAHVSLVTLTQCEFYMKINDADSDRNRKQHNSFMCATGKPGVNMCTSNQGGSLVCQSRKNPNQYIQVGVASKQINCTENVPGLFASIEANEKWLASQLQKNMIIMAAS